MRSNVTTSVVSVAFGFDSLCANTRIAMPLSQAASSVSMRAPTCPNGHARAGVIGDVNRPCPVAACQRNGVSVGGDWVTGRTNAAAYVGRG